MQSPDDDNAAGPLRDLDSAAGIIHCKLFADVVTEHLCLLRRRELNQTGGFSCEGCCRKAASAGDGESEDESPSAEGPKPL